MIVQFNYILAFMGLLYVHYSDSQLYGRDTDKNNKISENLNNYIDEKLENLESNIIENFKTIIRLEHNTKQDTDVTPNILPNSTGRDIKQPEIIETLDKKLAEIEVRLQNSITEKFQTLEDNRIKESNDIVNSIKLAAAPTKILNEITKRLSEIENYLQNNVNGSFRVLEDKIDKMNGLTNSTQLLLATNIKKLSDRIDSKNKKLKEVNELKNNISAKIQSLKNEIENLINVTSTVQVTDNDTNELKNSACKQASFCNIAMPESVHTNKTFWEKPGALEKDDLDIFMINKTGCKYAAVRYFPKERQETTFNGDVYEWRGGVRAWQDFSIKVGIGEDPIYSFYIGINNMTTRVIKLLNRRLAGDESISTPGIISPERYVWLHLRIKQEHVTLKTECDGALTYSGNLGLRRGDKLDIVFAPLNQPFAKLLHQCPVNEV